MKPVGLLLFAVLLVGCVPEPAPEPVKPQQVEQPKPTVQAPQLPPVVKREEPTLDNRCEELEGRAKTAAQAVADIEAEYQRLEAQYSQLQKDYDGLALNVKRAEMEVKTLNAQIQKTADLGPRVNGKLVNPKLDKVIKAEASLAVLRDKLNTAQATLRSAAGELEGNERFSQAIYRDLLAKRKEWQAAKATAETAQKAYNNCRDR